MQIKNSKLRIIGGKFRGRKITFNHKDSNLRPSLDRVRETVFNWLTANILDAYCLDLFAGSGIFGFEALSRGAKYICAIEKNFISCNNIINNKNNFGIASENLQIFNEDALFFLNNIQNYIASSIKFNIAFLDPPYNDRDLLLATLQNLLISDFMVKNSKIYFECDLRPSILEEQNFPKEYRLFKFSNTGRIGFYLLEKI